MLIVITDAEAFGSLSTCGQTLLHPEPVGHADHNQRISSSLIKAEKRPHPQIRTKLDKSLLIAIPPLVIQVNNSDLAFISAPLSKDICNNPGCSALGMVYFSSDYSV